MKINKLLLMPLMAALALGSCTSDAPVIDENTGSEGNGETNYLTVNLVSTPSNGTRAEGDESTTDTGGTQHPDEKPGDKAIYEEGYASENKVSSIRFYFFDKDGKAASVKANGRNWVDATKIAEDGKNPANVEKIIKATIVIHTGEGDQLPTQIVAVVNSAVEALGTDNLDLSTLRDLSKDYVATATGKNGAFVMMNSVYANGSSEVSTTTVAKENYQPTEALAETKPVNIYVERAVAKVRVKFDGSIGYDAETKMIPLKKVVKDDQGKETIKPLTIFRNGIEEQVYLKVSGWNLTAETDKSYRSKHIDVTWSDAAETKLFGTESWNYSPYFRSYWAQNASGAEQSWHQYDEIGSKGFDGSLSNSIYTNENAPQISGLTQTSTGAATKDFTKVIIAGNIVDEDGNSLEIVKYAGSVMIGEDAIRTTLLSLLNTNGMIYVKETVNGEISIRSLEEKDVVFKTALDAKIEGVDESESTNGRYKVYLQLKSDDLAKLEWSKNGDKDSFDAGKIENPNKYLASEFANIQIYKGGQTYYYFPIRHLGDSGKTGFYGVVRNHIYDCNINTITGFGTPVYEPSQTIYPEKPKDDDTFVAAQINILSWRVVTNNVDLKW